MGKKDGKRQLMSDDDSFDTISILSGSMDQLSVGSMEDSGILKGSKTWLEELESTIDDLIEVKKIGAKEREEHLEKIYVICTRHYAKRISENVASLEELLLKIFNGPRSDKELILTIRIMCTFCLASVFQVEELWTKTEGRFNALANDAESSGIKCESILCFSLLTALLDSEADVIEFGDFLISILESDGAVVNSEDDEGVVGCACQALGLLLTCVTTESEFLASAAEALSEQLDAASIDVQLAAGQALAALFERVNEIRPDKDEENDESDVSQTSKFDDIIPDRNQLLITLRDLASESSKSIGKKQRKVLHQVFRNVLQTIEEPNARNILRNSVRIGQSTVQLDSWKKILRAQMLRYVLGSSFSEYFAKSTFIRYFLGYSGYVAGLSSRDPDSDFDSDNVDEYIDDHKRGLSSTERRDLDRVRDKQKKQDQRVRADYINSVYFSQN
ncbi:hypothetical protein POMI540_1619 [Schizosaccharomyces pombe]|uniref:Uncharacterized protein C20F10.03 n=1 Tax=Schizosaccharomyces pombe (strain 972 / ATCC 24843) TaxID=284812 RepID=YGZ3_SCHPO|nr:uncharacterized protein SPBC20F10.03 [Schizosaccharomyces pombe]O42973.1 RecName: Full=Uncharacterized protein C20F10.03 [Schizosaccharomyces pombe 972h-]CAA16843.1 conserved eukaryotic protein [Schizosaccharomyces pombe]|eukprot:NP_596367.1 uncharacterized protein SPBC20F10.03 [Schizosaccharomyces pombe]